MKKIISLVLVMTVCLSLTQIVQANYFSGGFPSAHLTYAVGGGSSSYASTAASQWNGVSSNASFTYDNSQGPYGYNANVITYFNLYDSPSSGLLGKTYPYKNWTGASASLATTNDKWVKAVVYQYKNSSLNTETKRKHTCTHELGHTLGVAHPSSKSTKAVMQQGALSFYNLKNYDKNSLKAKRGE